MSVGLGVDIVDIKRMRRVLDRTPSFATRVFTPDEQAYCNTRANPATGYAARFAAKEAVAKALGVGILMDGGIGLLDVEVVHDRRGRPAVRLTGHAAEIAREQGIIDIPLSLSYTHEVAVANAVAISEADRVEQERHRDQKAELAQQFREMRGMLDELNAGTIRGAAEAMADDGDADPAAAAADDGHAAPEDSSAREPAGGDR
jgi:holo-[acyl-carrier protein] synthase